MLDSGLSLSLAFALGVLSTTHCLGMCGGIIGALSLSMPAPMRTQRRRQAVFVLLYNAGRTGSYTLAGALLGGLGGGLLAGVDTDLAHRILQLVAALILLAVGLHLAGWLPQLSHVERLGVPLWRRIEPFGRRLLPVTRPWQALVYGAIWGWLPCGMVYTLLLWATTTGDAGRGALVMAAFGLGTLPAMLASGMMAQRLVGFARRPATRRIAGVVVGVTGLATLWLPNLVGHAPLHLFNLTSTCP